jgi:hypothetical protein
LFLAIFHHYTDAGGYRGILTSKVLRPSLKAKNRKDARYGDGQYFSDIAPSTKTAIELSELFLRTPYGAHRFSHYFSIDLSGYKVEHGRPHVYVVKNPVDMPIANRIVKHGIN